MPRARENASARGSRYAGVVSGTTFVTTPSGVTIYKGQVDFTTWTVDGLVNTGGTGYTLPYLSGTGLLMATGVIANPITTGVTKVEASFFGMTAVNFCWATVGVTNLQSQVATAQVHVTTAKESIFTSAGVSRVYFRAYTGTGEALKRPASIQYFAIGV